MPLGQWHQFIEIYLAGRDQRDVRRAITAREVVAHGFDRQLGDALNGAQYAAAQRMSAEVQAPCSGRPLRRAADPRTS